MTYVGYIRFHLPMDRIGMETCQIGGESAAVSNRDHASAFLFFHVRTSEAIHKIRFLQRLRRATQSQRL